MIQKCSLWKVFSVFFSDPLEIHYIKEIARKINLAPTSVKLHLNYLLKQDLLLRKKGERFIGFIANRDNQNFFFYKKIGNLIKIKESGLLDFLIKNLHPQALVLYGSYFRGEDVKTSDIDLFMLTKVRKKLLLNKFEYILNKNIHLIMQSSLKSLTPEFKNEVINGLVLKGYLK